MRRHFWATAFAAFLLTGCFTSSILPEQQDLGQDGESGLAFGTIGTSGNDGTITSRHIQYRVVGADTSNLRDRSATGTFSYVNADGGLTIVTRMFYRMPTDVSEGDARATLFVAELVPGEYEIYGETFWSTPYRGIAAHGVMREIEPMRFTIKAGRATYLGEFLSQIQMRRDQDGVPVFGGGYFHVSDKLSRDLVFLNARQDSAIEAEAIINAARKLTTKGRQLPPTDPPL